MKKTALILTLISALFCSAVAGALFVDLAEANWLVPTNPSPPSKPEISILLPESDKTYSTNIGIDFLVTGPNWVGYGGYIELSSISYSLDDKPAVAFVGEQIELSDSMSLIVRCLGNLTGFSDGFHSLVVYAQCKGKYSPEAYKWADFNEVGSSPKTHFSVDVDIEDNVLPEISILSPRNEAYNTSDIEITFKVSEPCSQIKYSLDGQRKVIIDGNTTLAGQSDGIHNLAIYASDLAGNTKSNVTRFTVAAPPTISIVSPENKYYGVTNVTLSFILNEPTSWIGYSLDNQDNQTITGNTTVTDLTYGSHNIVLYASDASGNIGASKTVKFSISEEPEPFPTTLVVAASGASIAVAAAILIVYFRKQRH
jgi:hypothetical protein